MADEDIIEEMQDEQIDIAFRNPKYNRLGTIDCEINHPKFGWIPTTLTEGEELADAILAKVMLQPENIAPFNPPTIEEQRQRFPTLSPRQLRYGLLLGGITEAMVDAAIESMPELSPTEIEKKARARIDWNYAPWYARTYPLINDLGVGFNLSPESIDTLWLAAAQF